MNRILLLTLSLLSFAAGAASISGTFTYPTRFVDGTTLTLAQIERMRIEYGTCSGSAFGTKTGEVIVVPPATSFSTPTLPPGVYCLRGFTRTTAAAGGLESAPTNVLSHTLPWSPPEPGTLVTVATVAYEIQLHPVFGPRLGRNVGTVPLGTECGVNVTGDYYEVPLDQVTLSKMPKSILVVARCG